jgi:hypothetical protein
MRLLTGWVVIALVATLALTGCGKKEGAGSVSVDTSSAKATVETIARAFKVHDGEALVACMPPEYKDTMGSMMVAAMEVATKADSLRKTAEAKFGKDAADKALAGTPAEGATKGGLLEGGVKDDGSVDWSKVKVTESGDTATVEIEGKASNGTLKKVNGKWCMEMKDMTPEKAKAQAEQGKKTMKAMGDVIVDVEKQVKDGKITKADDLTKALQDGMMKALMEAMKETPKPS